MARKYDLISELYRRTAHAVVSDVQNWQAFLRCACRNYRLRFDEQLLVPAGGAQKGLPACRICRHRLAGAVIYLGYEVIFSCHRRTPPYLS